MIGASATAMLRISRETTNGEGNFCFAATMNCGPNIPFFPAGYHTGAVPVFTIGLESAGLLLQAIDDAAACDEGWAVDDAACP